MIARRFEERIGKAIAELDSGDGVLVLTDLFAGTPAHKTTRYLKPGQVDVICGVNLPLFLELLGLREAGGLDLNTLMQTGKMESGCGKSLSRRATTISFKLERLR